MACDLLTIHERPVLRNARMILGFSGWMDGGDVSTGAVDTLVNKLDARMFAEIASEDLYITSFPGSMEISALFRPHVTIEDGLITAFEEPTNRFYCSEADNLILLLGKEPNFKWREYAACIFSVVEQFDVSLICFVGSVAGLVPHTREPRLFASVSDENLKPMLEKFRVRFTDYDGPGSIVTYLTRMATERNIQMANLVAEIPAYVQGANPRCIEAVTRQVAGILNLQVNLDDLRTLGDRMEEGLSEIIEDRPELLERIHNLEHDYDNDVFDTQMGDLKTWLEQQGIRMD